MCRRSNSATAASPSTAGFIACRSFARRDERHHGGRINSALRGAARNTSLRIQPHGPRAPAAAKRLASDRRTERYVACRSPLRNPRAIDHCPPYGEVDRMAVIRVLPVVEEPVHRQRARRALPTSVRREHVERGRILEEPRAQPAIDDELTLACAGSVEMRIDERQRAIEPAYGLRARRRQ